MSRVLRAIVGLWLAALAVFSGAQLTVEPTASPKPFVPANRWALAIGVSGYSESIGPLRYTAKEAKEFAQTLTDDFQFAPENVRLLADAGQAEVAPTSQNILAALDSLLSDKRLDKANLFVFYFSGHGVGTPNGDFLLPADVEKGEFETKGVPVREVIHRIVGAGLKNVLFIADACRAGTENDFGADLTDLCHQANIAVILGCSPGKRSYEYPALKQGAFTHFLLEGLKRPELRDASGALWASRLGVDVQTRVHDYTEPDHGKFAQVPALWGEKSTLDVLLAAYPQPPVSDAAILQFKSEAKKLNKEDYAAAMIAYAGALYEKDRTDETVEMLKTVDGLGELTPQARLILAIALDTLGRTGEAQRIYTSFLEMPDGFWRDFGLATSSSRSLDPAVRLRSAMGLFDSTDAWDIKLLAFGTINAWGNYEQKIHYAKLLSTAGAKWGPRREGYGQAQVAYLEGRWKDSIAAFDRAAQSPGAMPSDQVLYMAKLGPVIALADSNALDRYIEQGKAVGADAGFALIQKALIAKGKGDADGRVTNLKAALATDLSPNFVFLAAKVAGPYIGLLTEEFKAAALKHPYSWRARMVLYFVRKIQGDKTMDQDALAADRYMDDPLTFNSTLFDFMDSYMTEAVELGRLGVDLYRSQTDLYFLLLKDQSAQFGYDADTWMQFVRYGMFNERTAQVQKVVDARLKLTPERTPKDLKPMMMLLAMNRGDAATSKRLFESSFEPTERVDPAWFYACFEITQGHAKEAAQLIARLGPPSPALATRTEALRTYLLAANGKQDEAKKRLGKASDDAVVDAFEGLTWALLGDWKRAEPLLREQATKRVWAFLFLQEYAMRCLDARYRSTGRVALARDLAYSAAISQPGNPLFDRYSYGAAPGVAQFVGSTAMNGGTVDDKDPNLAGRLTFSVAGKGVFVGSFKPSAGEAIKLQGTTDGNGNVRGSGQWHGKRYSLTGKIAPPAVYKSYAGFHTGGQILQLVDDEGFRIAIIGRT